MNLQDIAKQVKEVKVPLEEQDILNFLKITRRWQYRNTWGHPSIEIIDSIGRRQSERFFDMKGEFIYDIWNELYDKGFTFILTNILRYIYYKLLIIFYIFGRFIVLIIILFTLICKKNIV